MRLILKNWIDDIEERTNVKEYNELNRNEENRNHCPYINVLLGFHGNR